MADLRDGRGPGSSFLVLAKGRELWGCSPAPHPHPKGVPALGTSATCGPKVRGVCLDSDAAFHPEQERPSAG